MIYTLPGTHAWVILVFCTNCTKVAVNAEHMSSPLVLCSFFFVLLSH